MAKHEYTPKSALQLLVSNIERANEDLADRMELAINEGKESQETISESKGAKRRRKRTVSYRVNIPYTDEEALTVALKVLEAHLVETRMFARAAYGEFFAVGVGPTRPDIESLDISRTSMPPTQLKEPKIIEIELEPETVQSKKQVANRQLEEQQDQDIDSLRGVFKLLHELTDFGK